MNKYPIYDLSSEKYKIIVGSVLFLILSYVFMYFGSKNNHDFLALTLSLIMQIIAYIAVIYVIIKK